MFILFHANLDVETKFAGVLWRLHNDPDPVEIHEAALE